MIGTRTILLALTVSASACASCHRDTTASIANYKIVSAAGEPEAMDDRWDATPDAKAKELLATYRTKVDSVMALACGTSDVSMEPMKPESALSNWIADILREASLHHAGHEADVAVFNIGAIRQAITKGEVTYGNFYQLLPFDNACFVVTLTGKQLKQLFREMATAGGEAVSGARITAAADKTLLTATVGDKEIDEDANYRVATTDYVAEGNGGLVTMKEAVDRYEMGTDLRSLVIDHVKSLTQRGEAIHGEKDGRFIILTE